MASISGSVTKNGRVFQYRETSRNNNRGIDISTTGATGEYMVSPNPHNNGAYNKNQEKFYAEAADSLAAFFTGNNRFPNDSQLSFDFSKDGQTYTFTIR